MTEEVLEKNAISASPDTIKLTGNRRRNSTGRITPRSSLSLPSSGEKVLSRYLRASIGSCHDLCKHGRKNVTEEEKHPVSPSFLITNAKSNKKENLVRSSILEEKKRVLAKLKAAIPKKIELSDDHKVIENKTESAANRRIACWEPDTKTKNASSVEKRTTSLTTKASKQKMPQPFKGSSTSSRPQVIKPKASRPSLSVDISARQAFPLKTKTLAMKSASPTNPSGASRGRNFQKKDMIQSLNIGKTGGNIVLKLLIAPLPRETHGDSVAILNQSKAINVKPASPVGIREEVKEPEYNNDESMDQISELIEPQPDIVDLDQLTSSVSGEDEEISESSAMSVTESYDEETESEVDMSNQVDTLRFRRNATVYTKDHFSSPHKLKFRRGKIVELQDESDAPRKLRFRKRRVVPENMDGNEEAVRSSSRIIDLVCPPLNDQGAQAQNILLRHQDMEGKKDLQGLFNNVIEETASKLVETRKSKVKALVGAFETVISLQDGKPASAV